VCVCVCVCVCVFVCVCRLVGGWVFVCVLDMVMFVCIPGLVRSCVYLFVKIVICVLIRMSDCVVCVLICMSYCVVCVLICMSDCVVCVNTCGCLCVCQAHFEQNPRDLQMLRHDRTLQPTRVQPHLQHIPPYLGEPGRAVGREGKEEGDEFYLGCCCCCLFLWWLGWCIVS